MTPEEQLVEAFSNWMWELIKPSIARIVNAAVAEAIAERTKACAAVADEFAAFGADGIEAQEIAAAIRALNESAAREPI